MFSVKDCFLPLPFLVIHPSKLSLKVKTKGKLEIKVVILVITNFNFLVICKTCMDMNPRSIYGMMCIEENF